MGSSPKAPPPPPDPRIAEEESRREGIAIGQLEQQRRARAGSASTILGGSNGSTALTRPTEEIKSIDPASTAAGVKEAEIDKFRDQRQTRTVTTEYGDGGGQTYETSEVTLSAAEKQATIDSMRKKITPAEMQVFNDAKKQKNVAQFIGRTRSRLGVTGTKGA